VQVPMDIPEQFLRIAAPNTHKPPYGVETCGILAGVVVRVGRAARCGCCK